MKLQRYEISSRFSSRCAGCYRENIGLTLVEDEVSSPHEIVTTMVFAILDALRVLMEFSSGMFAESHAMTSCAVTRFLPLLQFRASPGN